MTGFSSENICQSNQSISGTDLIIDGWFHERGELWPGQAMTFQVKKVIHHSRSKYQDILVFESMNHGMVLVLDGAIQVTENDEFSYQEMMAHLPLYAHPNPKRVLVIGGGDGASVVRHVFVLFVALVRAQRLGNCSVVMQEECYEKLHVIRVLKKL
jgi:hypothetical protein